MTRAELLAHLTILAERGHVAPCLVYPDAGWTSNDPAEQHTAARLCEPCPAVTACRDYGLEHPREVGVYGGRTDTERHRTAEKGAAA